MTRFEQEPLTSFRRDVVAEDEHRLRVEAIAADMALEGSIAVAWAVRRITGQTYVCRPWGGLDIVLQASEILRPREAAA